MWWKYLVVVIFFIIYSSGCYLKGRHDENQEFKAYKNAINQERLNETIKNKSTIESVMVSYNKLELQNQQNHDLLQYYINQHAKDLRKYNTLNKAYMSVLQHQADNSYPILENESGGLEQIDSVLFLKYNVNLYKDDVECVNQVNSLIRIIKGIKK